MRELFFTKKTAEDETGAIHAFLYTMTIGNMGTAEAVECESYGAKIEEENGDVVLIPNITVSAARINQLMELLVRNVVTPASAYDVIQDWL